MKLSHPALALFLLALSLLQPACTTAAASSSDTPSYSESCAAGADPAALAPTPENGITPPRVVRRVDPKTPGHLLGREAVAILDAVIGTDGKPRHICIREGDREWGLAVAAAFEQWVFEPATLDGKPVTVLFTLTSRLRG